MGLPAANAASLVTATDVHIVLVPSPGGPVPTPLPHAFVGAMDSGLAGAVNVMGQPAATAGTGASNRPPHLPTPPGVSFQSPPSDTASILLGSATVRVAGAAAARHGDVATTCNDPADLPAGSVVVPASTVTIG